MNVVSNGAITSTFVIVAAYPGTPMVVKDMLKAAKKKTQGSAASKRRFFALIERKMIS